MMEVQVWRVMFALPKQSRDIFRGDTNGVEKLVEDPENMSKLTAPKVMQLFGKENSRC